MIDAHIHLDQYDKNTLDSSIEQWKKAGIKQVVAMATNLASSYETLETQLKYPDFVLACVGFHPEFPLPPKQDVAEWKRLILKERKRISAIGEIGLPYYQIEHLPDSLEQHREFLSEYLSIAASNTLPVSLHAVHDQAEIVLSLLQQFQIQTAHFHWLKAPEHVLQQIIDAGYFVSVTPEVCYRSRDQQLVKKVPLSQLLIETDGPWPFDQQFKDMQTTPLFLKEVVRQIAVIKQKTEADIIQQTVLNTQRCYL